MVQKSNCDYTLVVSGVLPYYGMKLVTIATDTETISNKISNIYKKNFNKMPLTLYEIENVKVPIEDQNSQGDSYSEVKTTNPYIAINKEYYIQLRI